jgi:hypothetical protein
VSSQEVVYIKIKAVSGNQRIKNIYVPLLANPFAELHIETYDHSGYGGSNKAFKMVDGTYSVARGPWHVPLWDDVTFKQYAGESIHSIVNRYVDTMLLEEN